MSRIARAWRVLIGTDVTDLMLAESAAKLAACEVRLVAARLAYRDADAEIAALRKLAAADPA